MNNLEGVSVYLSSAIDREKNDGVIWRREFAKKCKKAKLPLKIFDPTNKPKHLGSEIGDEKLRIQRLMQQRKWEQAKSEIKVFRRYDLRMVDHCHLFIIYIDLNVFYCGSWDEFNVAEREGKPIFVIMAPGFSKYDIPSWAVASVNEDETFESVDECIDHLKLINEGKILMDRRWVIV